MTQNAEESHPILAELPGLPPPDDMLDDAGYFPEGSPLREPAEEVLDAFGGIYAVNDAAAIAQQKRYRRVARRAAAFGAAAIVLAIVQLVFKPPSAEHEAGASIGETGFAVAELLFVVAAIWAVARGLWAAVHSGWLVSRHRAERCRIAKYRFLIDARLWTGVDSDRQAWRRDLRKTAEQIADLDEHAAERWMEDDRVESPPSYAALTGREDAVRALATYYHQRRLNKQLDFFARRMHADKRSDRATKPWPVIMFYVSVLAAIAHLVLHIGVELVTAAREREIGGHNHSQWVEILDRFMLWLANHLQGISRPQISTINHVLLLLALALPAVSAAVRTWRSALEFGRNTLRFKAKYMGLRHIADGFEVHTDPVELMRRMWYSEQILEAEHREWLRLMAEAEWFA